MSRTTATWWSYDNTCNHILLWSSVTQHYTGDVGRKYGIDLGRGARTRAVGGTTGSRRGLRDLSAQACKGGRAAGLLFVCECETLCVSPELGRAARSQHRMCLVMFCMQCNAPPSVLSYRVVFYVYDESSCWSATISKAAVNFVCLSCGAS